MTYYCIEIITTFIFTPVFLEQVIDLCQSLQQLQFIFISIIVDLLFHISSSGAFLLLPDLINKHLSSSHSFIDRINLSITLFCLKLL